MRDDMRTLRRRLVLDLGKEKVAAYGASDTVRAFLLFKWHEPERTKGFELIELISRWVDQRDVQPRTCPCFPLQFCFVLFCRFVIKRNELYHLRPWDTQLGEAQIHSQHVLKKTILVVCPASFRPHLS
jgi:hypothetical protein